MKDYRASSASFKNENFLLDALFRWVYYSREEREKHLQDLVGMVDFGKVLAICEDFILKEYQVSFELVEECADGRIVKRARIKPFDRYEECTDDQMFQLVLFEDPQFSHDSFTLGRGWL